MNTGMSKTVRPKRPAPVESACESTKRYSSRRQPQLTRKQLDELQRLLLTCRDELIADTFQLDDELHDTQAGQDRSDEIECSSKFEQAEIVALLLQAGWHELREINDALHRMDTGVYGICLGTGVPIGVERLRARPWAKYCIEYARTLEKQRPTKAVG